MSNNYIVLIVISFFTQVSAAQVSQCYGEAADGHLSNGVQLPLHGENYMVYARAGYFFGRTYVHSAVRDIVLTAYASLALTHPHLKYMYGETGLAKGGMFAPHKTHQNGLSVDFMVPVVRNNKSDYLPISASNKFGYGIEFNNEGHYRDFTVDYAAMIAHISALNDAAKEMGYAIKKVIFDPVLQKHLINNESAKALMDKVSFSKNRVWVRHDEHYHIDFSIPCVEK